MIKKVSIMFMSLIMLFSSVFMTGCFGGGSSSGGSTGSGGSSGGSSSGSGSTGGSGALDDLYNKMPNALASEDLDDPANKVEIIDSAYIFYDLSATGEILDTHTVEKHQFYKLVERQVEYLTNDIMYKIYTIYHNNLVNSGNDNYNISQNLKDNTNIINYGDQQIKINNDNKLSNNLTDPTYKNDGQVDLTSYNDFSQTDLDQNTDILLDNDYLDVLFNQGGDDVIDENILSNLTKYANLNNSNSNTGFMDSLGYNDFNNNNSQLISNSMIGIDQSGVDIFTLSTDNIDNWYSEFKTKYFDSVIWDKVNPSNEYLGTLAQFVSNDNPMYQYMKLGIAASLSGLDKTQYPYVEDHYRVIDHLGFTAQDKINITKFIFSEIIGTETYLQDIYFKQMIYDFFGEFGGDLGLDSPQLSDIANPQNLFNLTDDNLSQLMNNDYFDTFLTNYIDYYVSTDSTDINLTMDYAGQFITMMNMYRYYDYIIPAIVQSATSKTALNNDSQDVQLNPQTARVGIIEVDYDILSGTVYGEDYKGGSELPALNILSIVLKPNRYYAEKTVEVDGETQNRIYDGYVICEGSVTLKGEEDYYCDTNIILDIVAQGQTLDRYQNLSKSHKVNGREIPDISGGSENYQPGDQTNDAVFEIFTGSNDAPFLNDWNDYNDYRLQQYDGIEFENGQEVKKTINGQERVLYTQHNAAMGQIGIVTKQDSDYGVMPNFEGVAGNNYISIGIDFYKITEQGSDENIVDTKQNIQLTLFNLLIQ